VGQKVLIYNSQLRLFPGKLKSRLFPDKLKSQLKLNNHAAFHWLLGKTLHWAEKEIHCVTNITDVKVFLLKYRF
jgi:hypothetical protein